MATGEEEEEEEEQQQEEEEEEEEEEGHDAAPLQQLLCEVHEHAALVRLYDAVLQPGG